MHFVCVNTNDIINNDMNSHLVKIFPVAASGFKLRKILRRSKGLHWRVLWTCGMTT